MPKKQKKKPNELSRHSVAQIGIILGQMSYAKPATVHGLKVRIIDEGVLESWQDKLHEILEKEI